MKWWRLWDKWALIENLLTVRSLKRSDKIRWKEKNWLSPFECSLLWWDHNTTPLLKIDFQAVERKVAQVNVSKWLRPLLKEQKEVCWINGEGMWDGGVRFMEITDSIFCVSEIRLGFPCTIWVVIASPMNEVFEFFYFLGKNPQCGPPPIRCPCLQLLDVNRPGLVRSLPFHRAKVGFNPWDINNGVDL